MDAVTTATVLASAADVMAAAARAAKKHHQFEAPRFGYQLANPNPITAYSSDSKYRSCFASGHGKEVCRPHPSKAY